MGSGNTLCGLAEQMGCIAPGTNPCELEGRRYPVKELVDHYDLETLIEELEADALLDQDEWERRRAADEAERINAYRELGLEPPC